MPKNSAVKQEIGAGSHRDGKPLVEEEILTSREARALLKIGRTKLHELTHRQAIPAYRVGAGRTSGLRYRKSDLLEWLYSQRVRG
jgi:excisionase family DNA binding protein